MVNQHLTQRLVAIQQVLMAHHSGSKGLPTAMVGNEREAFIREFLQRVFPSHRRFSTGVITDSLGGLSGQIDIAIEYGFSPSFPMPSTEDRLLLAESVALVIEVKSNLSSQWDQVQTTTKAVKNLQRDLCIIAHVGDEPPKKIPVIAVGYTGHTSSESVAARLAATPEEMRPDGALVIESGAFAGFGLKANGGLGLFAMTWAIDDILGQLITARPNLLTYVLDSNVAQEAAKEVSLQFPATSSPSF